MTTDIVKVGGFDIGDMSTSSPFGFHAEWSDENVDTTPQVAKFRVIQLKAKKLKLYSEASNELVMDGNDFENQVGGAMIQAVGWTLDDACLYSGTGAGQPLSVLKDPALVTVDKEFGQTASTIVYENIVKMYSRLHPIAMRGAVWVANSTTLPELLVMYIGTGTSGTIAPAVKESDSNFTLLGMPLLFTEKLPTLGYKGDLLLVNFSHYVLGLRKEVTLEKSNAPGWGRDVLSYRTILRADGMGKWNKPQTPKNGSSRSWCVTLAARQ